MPDINVNVNDQQNVINASAGIYPTLLVDVDHEENTVSVTVEKTSPVVDVQVVATGPVGPPGADGQDGAPGADGADGQDGFSPVISSETITGGHRLTIVDIGGTTTVDVMDGVDGQDGADGADGADGFSPVVAVSSITGGHEVSITDAAQTQTFNVMDGVDGQNGQDGQDGQDGADGVSPEVTVTDIAGGHRVTITDADHPGGQTFDVMDGQDGATGPGVPDGGAAGQILGKKSATNQDTEWIPPGIPYVQVDDTSTSTVFTASHSAITKYYHGLQVLVKNGVVTSASGFTLNINGLGAKPVYSSMAAATALTSVFNVNYTLLLIYDEDRVEGGCWLAYYGYYTSTNSIGYQIRAYGTVLPTLDKFYRYRMLFTSPDGKSWIPSNTSSSTSAATEKTPNTRPFNPFGPICVYSTTAAINAGSSPSAAYVWTQYSGTTFGYAFNNTNAALNLEPMAPIYIIATPQADGSAVLYDYTQTLPSTEDGKIYICIGYAIDATKFELLQDKPVYYYKDGCIRLWTNVASGGGGGAEDVVWATYGTTTSADIEAAYQANKVVALLSSGRVYYLGKRDSSTDHFFYAAIDTRFYVCRCTNDSWSNYNYECLELGDAGTIPAGGNAGQVLSKNSATDYDVHWVNQTQDYPSAYCITAAGTAAKKASCSLWTATANSYLHVLIGAANTSAGAITLNVNSTGAKPIYINGTASSATNYTLPAGSYIVFYDGTNFYFRTDGKLTADITGTAGGNLTTSDAASNAPADLGTAAVGTSTKYAREDHVHKLPTAADVGAQPASGVDFKKIDLNANYKTVLSVSGASRGVIFFAGYADKRSGMGYFAFNSSGNLYSSLQMVDPGNVTIAAGPSSGQATISNTNTQAISVLVVTFGGVAPTLGTPAPIT